MHSLRIQLQGVCFVLRSHDHQEYFWILDYSPMEFSTSRIRHLTLKKISISSYNFQSLIRYLGKGILFIQIPLNFIA